MTAFPFPAPLRRFRDLFNRGRYWESHEVLEAAWRAGRSDFYKGLILYASAFVHVQRGNRHGVQAQLRKAHRVLDPYRPHYLGVAVDALLNLARDWEETARHSTPSSPWPPSLSRPRIALRAGRVRGDEPELDPRTRRQRPATT